MSRRSRSRSPSSSQPPPLLTHGESTTAFLTHLADNLLLPEETLATAFLYKHRYERWNEKNKTPESQRLDEHMLAIASLSLAAKSTEHPRRLREFLLPSHTLAQPPSTPPLTFPSTLYDTLRQSLVNSEHILLRTLGFELRSDTKVPYFYLPELVSRCLGVGITEEGGVATVGVMGTALGLEARRWARWAASSRRFALGYPAKTVAVICVRKAVHELGLKIAGVKEREDWELMEEEDPDARTERMELEDGLEEFVERVAGASKGGVDLEDVREGIRDMTWAFA
ncbi:hypothetical protein G7K_6255-t1 [Saitoella complicata NRRL Y-17804]|nr:hypothetical protein G7K_6255-t1 [Saitoella complicata NRRL Y-17804]